MTPNYPHHSPDGFMHNATPVQSFVDPPHEVTDEERNRPRYGRPQRKPVTQQPELPNPTGEEPDAKP